MENVTLKEGDSVWFFMGDHKGVKTRGTIVKVVRLDKWVHDHYIIEIGTGIEPIYEVRDGYTISDMENAPIGMWRNLR